MDKRLLDILCCPSTKAPVRLMGDAELAALNRAIGENRIVNAKGTCVAGELAVALITRDGRTIYRVEDDIPVMLVDEAIASSQLADVSARGAAS